MLRIYKKYIALSILEANTSALNGKRDSTKGSKSKEIYAAIGAGCGTIVLAIAIATAICVYKR